METVEKLSFEQIERIEKKYGESTFIPFLYKILKLKG